MPNICSRLQQSARLFTQWVSQSILMVLREDRQQSTAVVEVSTIPAIVISGRPTVSVARKRDTRTRAVIARGVRQVEEHKLIIVFPRFASQHLLYK